MKKLLLAVDLFCRGKFIRPGSGYFLSHFMFRILLVLTLVTQTPALAADYQVTNLNDRGAGSLRLAITDASDNDTIFFAPGLTGTIELGSVLPKLDSVTFVNAKNVTLSWSGAGVATALLNINSGKTIKGTLPWVLSIDGVNQPMVIKAGGSIVLDKDLSGAIVSSADKNAVGLLVSGITLNNGLSGSISATSINGAAAGMVAQGNIEFNQDLAGSIAAQGESFVSAMETEQTMTLNGGLTGKVHAAAAQDRGVGLQADRGFTLNEDLAGSVIATAGGKKAYGIWSEYGGIIIKGLSGSIAAEAGGDDARALHSSSGMIIEGLTGSVEARAGGDKACGLLSLADMNINGDLSGSVTAAAGGGTAFGIYADDNFVLNGDMSGSIRASGGKGEITGLQADRTLLIKGKLSGSIFAAGGGDRVYGIRASRSLALTDDLAGSVWAVGSGNDVYGLKSDDGSISLLDLSGAVTAKGGGHTVYGIYSYNNDLAIAGDLSGTVTAMAGGYTAMGLYSRAGAMNNGAGQAMNISGSVLATAHGLAVAAAGNGGLNLNVTGQLGAQDLSGAGEAYAVRAGMLDWRTNAWIPGGAVDDFITLGNKAQVTGRIELGSGTNLLTLDGRGTLNGGVSNITTMTKTGAGTWAAIGRIHTRDLKIEKGTLSLDSSFSHVVDNTLVVADGGVLTAAVRNPGIEAVRVGSTVTNGGQIHFKINSLVPSGTTFTMLSSKGLSEGGLYTSSSPFLTIHTDANNVEATKKRYTDISLDNPNSQRLAVLLDPLTATATGDAAAILTRLEDTSSPEEFKGNLEQLNSLSISSIPAMGMDVSRMFSSAVQTRLAERRSAYTQNIVKTAMDPKDPDTWPLLASNGDLAGLMGRQRDDKSNGLHFRLLGQKGGVDSQDGFHGYDYDTTGLSGGLDTMPAAGLFNKNFLAGISLGYASTAADYKDAGKSCADMEIYSLGVYTTWFDRGWYVDTTLAGAFTNYEIRRVIPFLNRRAESDSSGHTLSAKTAGGYRFNAKNFGLTPMISLEYTRFHQDDYTETNAFGANLSVDALDTNSLRTGLGARIDHTWETGFGCIRPEISAMWMHELASPDNYIDMSMAAIPGVTYPVAMAGPDRDFMVLGMGATVVNNPGIALSLKYQGEFLKNAHSHSLIFDFIRLF